jgi:hypothetical protein
MEDLLDVYVREPLPVQPGSPTKQDSEYESGVMTNLFKVFEPSVGRSDEW